MLEASINSGKQADSCRNIAGPQLTRTYRYADVPEAKFVMDRDQVAKCAQHCNAKRDAAKIAQEQSDHLHLCYLIDDLTKKYGPVIRDAKIVGVLDSAFDVVVVCDQVFECTRRTTLIFRAPIHSLNSESRSACTPTRCRS
jgi:exoribonuclease R